MKKRLLLLLFSIISLSVFAVDEFALVPAKGMMKTHYINFAYGSDRTKYKALYASGNENDVNHDALGGSNLVDELAVALLQINRGKQSFDDAELVSVSVTYDGFFVSDENPSIVRPYDIVYVEKVVAGGAKDYVNRIVETGGDFFTFPSDSIVKEYPNRPANNWYWIDFVLQLPGENQDRGVLVDNTYYPLIEGRYSSEIQIVAEAIINGSTQTLNITIPLMAEYTSSPVVFANRNSQVSMNVNMNANSRNLNLTNMLQTGNLEDIGNLSFMIRYASNSSEGTLASASTDYEHPSSTEGNYKIFLSSSSYPFEPNSDGFMFVHEDFVPGEHSYTNLNSVNFYITVEETGDSKSQKVTYDGKEYCDVTTGDMSYGTELYSNCHKFKVLEEGNFTHYHTFEGKLSINVAPDPSTQMMAGRYHGEIYVHVIEY